MGYKMGPSHGPGAALREMLVNLSTLTRLPLSQPVSHSWARGNDLEVCKAGSQGLPRPGCTPIEAAPH